MKVKLSVIKSAESTIEKIYHSDMPVGVAYAVSRSVDVIDAELKRIETFRQNLVTKYGERNDSGVISVSTDNIEKFKADYQALMESEVVLNIDEIFIDDFADAVMLSPAEMSKIIGWFVKKKPD